MIYTRSFWTASFERAVKAFAWALSSLLIADGTDILDSIRTEKALSEATEKKLVAFIDKFAKGFTA